MILNFVSTNIKNLNKEVSLFFSYLLSLTISSVFILFFFNSNFIFGKSGWFFVGDNSVNFVGWHYYVNDIWRFPILNTQNLQYPKGISIAFTDSIPIAAIFFKSLRHFLPNNFNYFGLWLILCILLQGISITSVIRLLNEKRIFPIIAINIFVLTYPSFLKRITMHVGLSSHWLIIFSLALVIAKSKNIISSLNYEILFRFLLITSLLIHPYFLAMNFLIYLGFGLDNIVNRIIQVRKGITSIIITFLLLISTMILLNYFTEGTIKSNGYDIYSMNLSSLICGNGTILLPNCNIDATGGQYEGANYLGLGLILLMLVFIKNTFLTIKGYFIRLKFFFLSLFLLFSYSLGPIIYLGKLELLDLHLSNWTIGTIFRSSGRFFWPVGYSLIILIFISLKKYFDKIYIQYFVVLLIFIQILDLKQYFIGIKNEVNYSDIKSNLRLEKWERIMKNVSFVRIQPGNCGGNNNEIGFFQLAAAMELKPIQGAYVSHGGTEVSCNDWINFKPIKNELDITFYSINDPHTPFSIKNEWAHGMCKIFSKGEACINNKSG